MKLNNFQEFVGKTILEVNDIWTNCVVFKFTDGTQAQVMSECGSGPYDIPYLEVVS